MVCEELGVWGVSGWQYGVAVVLEDLFVIFVSIAARLLLPFDLDPLPDVFHVAF